MMKRRLSGLLAVAALAVAVVPATASADTPNSLFATAAASLGDNGGNATDRNWYDFDVLANAVVALGLGPALQDNGDGLTGLGVKATVFAPNDRAFQLLVADVTGRPWWRVSEKETLDTLLAVAGTADLNGSGISGAEALKQTVLYHVSPENIANLRARSFGADIPTANTVGRTDIDPAPVPFLGWASLRDGDPNDVNPLWYGRTIRASNGTIHVVAGVLRPLDLKALFPAD
jgi:hypothetical protein